MAETNLLDALPLWTISDEPVVVLGDDGTPGRQFTRTISARLPNGDLLVADAGSKELRVFREGSLAARLSRQGSGPGELQDIQRISLVHDTIIAMALPMVSRDVNIYTAEGGFLARFRPRPPVGGPAVVPLGWLTDGSFLVEESRGFTALTREPPIGQLIPDSVSWGLLRQTPEDSVGTYQPLGRFRRHFMVAFRTPQGPIPFSMTQFTLGPTTQWAVSGGLVWIADGATGVLLGFDGQGLRVLEVHLPVTAEQFTEPAASQARHAALARASDDYLRAQAEAAFDPALRPATMPVLDALVPGPDGEVWVRRFRLDDTSPQQFVVVSQSGQPVARVGVPADVAIHHIGADFIVGVRRDHDGVENVVEYRLGRGRSEVSADAAEQSLHSDPAGPRGDRANLTSGERASRFFGMGTWHRAGSSRTSPRPT